MILALEGTHGKVDFIQNFGKIRNRGLELSTSWNDKIGDSGFDYSISGNLTTIDNEVLKIGNDPNSSKIDSKVSRTMESYPLAHFYGYKVIGVYQNEADIASSPSTTLSVSPGDLKYADTDGDGKITDKDRTMIGNPTPDFTYGLNLSIGYKGFDLSADMMGVYGNEIYRSWSTSDYAQFNYHTDRLSRWNGEGTSNWEPILDPSRASNQQPSSYFIEDGSFFRIRNIQLGYTFDQSILQKLRIKSLRLYGNIQNLKTWHKASGYTPEIGGKSLSFGVDKGTYPMPVVYTFGLNLTF